MELGYVVVPESFQEVANQFSVDGVIIVYILLQLKLPEVGFGDNNLWHLIITNKHYLSLLSEIKLSPQVLIIFEIGVREQESLIP